MDKAAEYLKLFDAAMAHPAGSPERQQGLDALRDALAAQVRSESILDAVGGLRSYWSMDLAVDWQKKAAKDED
jgi:hypothetical protein